MMIFHIQESIDNPRVAGVCIALLSYLGGASLSGNIDLTQLLATAISGVIAVAGWVLVAWLRHRWERKGDGSSSRKQAE